MQELPDREVPVSAQGHILRLVRHWSVRRCRGVGVSGNALQGMRGWRVSVIDRPDKLHAVRRRPVSEPAVSSLVQSRADVSAGQVRARDEQQDEGSRLQGLRCRSIQQLVECWIVHAMRCWRVPTSVWQEQLLEVWRWQVRQAIRLRFEQRNDTLLGLWRWQVQRISGRYVMRFVCVVSGWREAKLVWIRQRRRMREVHAGQGWYCWAMPGLCSWTICRRGGSHFVQAMCHWSVSI